MQDDESDASFRIHDEKQIRKEAYVILKDLTKAFSLTFKSVMRKPELK